jgi:hypothetical protein
VCFVLSPSVPGRNTFTKGRKSLVNLTSAIVSEIQELRTLTILTNALADMTAPALFLLAVINRERQGVFNVKTSWIPLSVS